MTSNSAPSAQSTGSDPQYSTAPNGEQFPLPTPQEEAAEIQRLQALVTDHRAQGHEIVIVLGVGFVGAVMAGIVADSVQKEIGGHPEETGSVNGDILGNREAIDKVSPLSKNANFKWATPGMSPSAIYVV